MATVISKDQEARRRAAARGRPGDPAAPVLAWEVGVLTASVGALCLLGLVMVLSASTIYADVQLGSPFSILTRQAEWMGIGLGVAVLARAIPLSVWRKGRLGLLGLAFFLLLAVFVPGLGHHIAGSSRWIGTASFQIQPSELMKLALIVFGADLLARRADRVEEFGAVVRPLLIVFGVAAILVVGQPDLGTAIVLTIITFGLLISGGVPLRLVTPMLIAVGAVGTFVAFGAAYRRARLLSFINPFAHATGSGYQVVQSLVAISSGHLQGAGVGASYVSWGFLPNNQTDFIFAMVANELGAFGAIAVLGLFGAIAWAGTRISLRSPDRFGSLVAAGVTIWICSQAFINIGSVIGVLPVTGVPLPFLSYGGTSLISVLAGVGLLLGVASDTYRRAGGGVAVGAGCD